MAYAATNSLVETSTTGRSRVTLAARTTPTRFAALLTKAASSSNVQVRFMFPFTLASLFNCGTGAHLPNFDASHWNRSGTPYTGISKAGIQAYRTTFNLNIPADVDIPIALKVTRTPSSSYRSMIFINGWQFGRFNSRDGPQEIFPVRTLVSNERRGAYDLCSFPRVS